MFLTFIFLLLLKYSLLIFCNRFAFFNMLFACFSGLFLFLSVFANYLIYLSCFLSVSLCVYSLSLSPHASFTPLLSSLIIFGTSPNLFLHCCGAQHSCALLLFLLLQTAADRQCLVSSCCVAKECGFWRR